MPSAPLQRSHIADTSSVSASHSFWTPVGGAGCHLSRRLQEGQKKGPTSEYKGQSGGKSGRAGQDPVVGTGDAYQGGMVGHPPRRPACMTEPRSLLCWGTGSKLSRSSWEP